MHSTCSSSSGWWGVRDQRGISEDPQKLPTPEGLPRSLEGQAYVSPGFMHGVGVGGGRADSLHLARPHSWFQDPLSPPWNPQWFLNKGPSLSSCTGPRRSWSWVLIAPHLSFLKVRSLTPTFSALLLLTPLICRAEPAPSYHIVTLSP